MNSPVEYSQIWVLAVRILPKHWGFILTPLCSNLFFLPLRFFVVPTGQWAHPVDLALCAGHVKSQFDILPSAAGNNDFQDPFHPGTCALLRWR